MDLSGRESEILNSAAGWFPARHAGAEEAAGFLIRHARLHAGHLRLTATKKDVDGNRTQACLVR